MKHVAKTIFIIITKGEHQVKRKRFSAVLGLLIILALIVGLSVPFASASPVVFLNPFGDVDPPKEVGLAPRLDDLDGANVLILTYGQANDTYTAAGLQSKLAALNPTATFATAGTGFTLGARTTYGAKDAAVYENWASYDAVIIAAVDDNIGAFWVSQHAKAVEALGTPVVVVATSPYMAAVKNGALKNGFSSIQIAELPNLEYMRSYAFATTARQAYFDTNVTTAAVAAKVADALTNDALPAGTPIQAVRSIDTTFDMPDNYGKATQKFLEKSLADGFGDGLALLVPTQELVDDLLDTVDRGKNDILGKMLGGGIITIEKVAINAAMAGVEPAAFPVVLAAMEAFAQDREKQDLFDYALRVSDSQLTVMMVVSGPISEQLGMRSDRSDLGSGPWGALNDANATIGRAVKLCFRNIGRNAIEDLQYKGGMTRMNDHALPVCSETLPAVVQMGWLSHTEFIGLGPTATANSITLIGCTQARMAGSTPGGGAASGWTMSTIISSASSAAAATGATASMPSIVTYPQYMAQILTSTNIGTASITNVPTNWNEVNGGTAYTGMTSKADVQNALAGTNAARNAKLVWPIIMGGDAQHARTFNGGTTFNVNAFQTQLISGKNGSMAPSAPTNFYVEQTDHGDDWVTLYWSAPANPGGAGTIRYEVSLDGGMTWTRMGTAVSYQYPGIISDEVFVVRAYNSTLRISAELALVGAAYDVVYNARGAWATNPIIYDLS